VYSAPSLLLLHLILPNIHTLTNQILPRLQYLRLNLLVRLGDIVEREDAPAELEEQVCAEGNESPEGELSCISTR
jgi:hypothetical protein